MTKKCSYRGFVIMLLTSRHKFLSFIVKYFDPRQYNNIYLFQEPVLTFPLVLKLKFHFLSTIFRERGFGFLRQGCRYVHHNVQWCTNFQHKIIESRFKKFTSFNIQI